MLPVNCRFLWYCVVDSAVLSAPTLLPTFHLVTNQSLQILYLTKKFFLPINWFSTANNYFLLIFFMNLTCSTLISLDIWQSEWECLCWLTVCSWLSSVLWLVEETGVHCAGQERGNWTVKQYCVDSSGPDTTGWEVGQPSWPADHITPEQLISSEHQVISLIWLITNGIIVQDQLGYKIV